MITKLKRVNGALKIDIDGMLFDPLSFKSFRPTEENISEFYASGIRLFSILSTGLNCFYGIPYSLYGESWIGEGQYDFSVVDKQIELFKKAAPDGYFALMFQIDTRDWWLNTHENYPNSYTHLSQMVADEAWRKAAADYTKALLAHTEEKYGDCIYAYFIMCGTTTEWLSDFDNQATHPIKESAYGKPIPTQSELELPEDIAFYQSNTVTEYQKFHATLISDTILYFAEKMQEVLHHKKMVGLYYGYIFELYNARVWNAGHLDYERVFKSSDIDIISSPSSYEFRAPDQTGAFMVTHTSLDKEEKLYYYEFDQRTYLSRNEQEGVSIPPAGYHCANDEEAVALMRRDFMLCASNGVGLWWFDMWNGWFHSEQMMEAVRNIADITKRISAMPKNSCAEVLVVVSPKSLYGVNKMSNIQTNLLFLQRDGLMRMGAPFDVYSADDLETIDTSRYKLIMFLTPFDIPLKREQRIQQWKKEGKTLFFFYAPGYLSQNMFRITDMDIFQTDVKPKYDGGGTVLGAPYFYVSDKNVIPLKTFKDGRCAIGYKNCDNYISVYSAPGNLDKTVLQSVLKLAGVHIYCETETVYINESLLGIYALHDVVIHVKKDGVYEDVFTGTQYISQDGLLQIPKDGCPSKLLIPIP